MFIMLLTVVKSYALEDSIVYCMPDTLGSPIETYFGYDSEPTTLYILKLYSDGIYSIDYQSLKTSEFIANTCIGKYENIYRGIQFYLNCDCVDHSEDLNVLKKSLRGLRVKSGDFKTYDSIKYFTRQ